MDDYYIIYVPLLSEETPFIMQYTRKEYHISTQEKELINTISTLYELKLQYTWSLITRPGKNRKKKK